MLLYLPNRVLERSPEQDFGNINWNFWFVYISLKKFRWSNRTLVGSVLIIPRVLESRDMHCPEKSKFRRSAIEAICRKVQIFEYRHSVSKYNFLEVYNWEFSFLRIKNLLFFNQNTFGYVIAMLIQPIFFFFVLMHPVTQRHNSNILIK